MNESEIAANFEDAVWYNEQTQGDLGFIGKHVLSRLTRGMWFPRLFPLFSYHTTLPCQCRVRNQEQSLVPFPDLSKCIDSNSQTALAIDLM